MWYCCSTERLWAGADVLREAKSEEAFELVFGSEKGDDEDDGVVVVAGSGCSGSW